MVKNFTSNKTLGKYGENLAKEYLEKREFCILDMNFRYSKFSEIDVVAIKNDILHFIEVKTRSQKRFGEPVEAVNIKKIKSIFECGMYYIKIHNIKYKKMQIDVIGIDISDISNPQYTFLEDISI